MLKRLHIISSLALLLCSPKFNFGQLSHLAPAPKIGSAKNFVIFTGGGAIDNSNTTVTTNVLGDIGTTAGAVTGFVSSNTSGVIHIGDPLTVQAGTDIKRAHDSLRLLSNTTATYSPNLISTIGNNQVFLPGVYFLGAAATETGVLTLDAQNDTSAVFIILIGGAFGTDGTSVIKLVNKATASHVFWWVDGAAVIYANTVFQGSLIVGGALTINAGSSIKGRGLVTTGAIHLVSTDLQGAAQIDSIAAVAAAAASTVTVSAKAYLQGALNSAGTALSTTLFDNKLIPLAQPYSGAPFNHVSTNSEAALTVIPSGVIDWVLVELLDANNNTVVASRAAFITSTGNIVDIDGTPGVKFDVANIPSGVKYNLGIRHRNHLAVRTGTPIAFVAGANTLIDFTTGPNGNLYTDPTKSSNNAPMVLINGVYSMWSGNTNSKGNVTYTGRNNCSGYILSTILNSNSSLLLKTYNNGDINFKGQTSYTGRGNSDGYLLTSVLNGKSTSNISQHY